jgi:hypothetical protein
MIKQIIDIYKTKEEYLSYKLGQYVGNQLVLNLPTLSCDYLYSREVIQVTWSEAKELYRLSDIWHKKLNEEKQKLYKEHPNEKHWKIDNKALELVKIEWNNYRQYANLLSEKYIPKEFDYILPGIELTMVDLKSFKDGISDSIWNCDYSYYDCGPEDIVIEESTHNFKYLTIKLKKHNKQ